MTQTSGSLSHPIALDYENTLVLAIAAEQRELGFGCTGSGPAAGQGETNY
jgi:hypothetical protein